MCIRDSHYLLAQTGRRSRLSVCLGKHGDSGPLFRISTELRYQFLYLRIVHLLSLIHIYRRNGKAEVLLAMDIIATLQNTYGFVILTLIQ